MLCARSIIDSQTNGVSLIDIVEQLNAPGLPDGPALIPASLDLVSFWTRGETNEPETGEGRFRLLAPDGKATMSGSASVDLAKHERLRNIARMSGLPLAGPGRYTFVVEFKANGKDTWSEVYRFFLPVTNTPEPSTPQQPTTE